MASPMMNSTSGVLPGKAGGGTRGCCRPWNQGRAARGRAGQGEPGAGAAGGEGEWGRPVGVIGAETAPKQVRDQGREPDPPGGGGRGEEGEQRGSRQQQAGERRRADQRGRSAP